MRVCVLQPSYDQSNSQLRELDTYADPLPHLADHEVETHFIHKASAVRQIEELASHRFDVFLNLCDGTATEDCAGIEVAETLERLGLAYTGARTKFFDPSREEQKEACERAGIATPQYVMTNDVHDARTIAEKLKFPLIVKHPRGYSSIALTRASRVESKEALADRLAEMITTYGSALVEEFIEGREFTVLVTEPGEDETEPRAYPPVEMRFPEGETFKHFDLKWIHYDGITWIPVADERLAARLVDISRRFFLALDGTGYGRVDLRSDAQGNVYVLEMNPNCGVFYPPGLFGCADFILDAAPGGHIAFTKHLLQCALRHASRAT